MSGAQRACLHRSHGVLWQARLLLLYFQMLCNQKFVKNDGLKILEHNLLVSTFQYNWHVCNRVTLYYIIGWPLQHVCTRQCTDAMVCSGSPRRLSTGKISHLCLISTHSCLTLHDTPFNHLSLGFTGMQAGKLLVLSDQVTQIFTNLLSPLFHFLVWSSWFDRAPRFDFTHYFISSLDLVAIERPLSPVSQIPICWVHPLFCFLIWPRWFYACSTSFVRFQFT